MSKFDTTLVRDSEGNVTDWDRAVAVAVAPTDQPTSSPTDQPTSSPTDQPASSRIEARAQTHGSFEQNSKFMQGVKEMARRAPRWGSMTEYQREGLDMIVHKMGRILYGDPTHLDHWDDVAGYAEVVAKSMRGEP